MPKIPHRILGKPSVSVPIFGIGTAQIDTRRTAKDVAKIFHETNNLGVPYIDAAPDFARHGRAQEDLGPILKERRNEVFLVTKYFEPNGEKVLCLLERNLKELQPDHTDLLFVHSLGHDAMDSSQVFSRRRVYPALMQAKEQVLPIAAKKNIGLVAMKVFRGQERSFFAGHSNRKVPIHYLDITFRYTLSLPQVGYSIIDMSTSKKFHQNMARTRNFTPITPRETTPIAPIGQTLAKK